MNAYIDIDINGHAAFALFQALPDKSKRAQPMLDDIGAYLDSDAVDRFDRGVAPDGTPWKKSQRALEQGGKTLIDTSILVSGITHNATNDELLHGSPEIYASIHQDGGQAGRNKSVTIEARPFIGFTALQEGPVGEIVTSWIDSWFPRSTN